MRSKNFLGVNFKGETFLLFLCKNLPTPNKKNVIIERENSAKYKCGVCPRELRLKDHMKQVYRIRMPNLSH